MHVFHFTFQHLFPSNLLSKTRLETLLEDYSVILILQLDNKQSLWCFLSFQHASYDELLFYLVVLLKYYFFCRSLPIVNEVHHLHMPMQSILVSPHPKTKAPLLFICYMRPSSGSYGAPALPQIEVFRQTVLLTQNLFSLKNYLKLVPINSQIK